MKHLLVVGHGNNYAGAEWLHSCLIQWEWLGPWAQVIHAVLMTFKTCIKSDLFFVFLSCVLCFSPVQSSMSTLRWISQTYQKKGMFFSGYTLLNSLNKPKKRWSYPATDLSLHTFYSFASMLNSERKGERRIKSTVLHPRLFKWHITFFLTFPLTHLQTHRYRAQTHTCTRTYSPGDTSDSA